MPTLAHRRLWWGIGWALVGLVLYLSLAPQPPLPEVGYDDRFGHTLAYATLMAWFMQLTARRGRLAVALLALGGGLEIMQGMSGYRDMSLADLIADGAGITIAWALCTRLPNLLAEAEKRLPGAASK